MPPAPTVLRDASTATVPGPSTVAVRWLFTAFLIVLVPVYLANYGPTNFLYFCDAALLLTLVSLWSGWRLPASMAAVGILVPQAVWTLDLLGHLAGWRMLGMTDYMFDAQASPFLRSLSLFHLWLPVLLLWLVARIGYDRRALWAWTVSGTVIMVICYALMPAPPAPPDQPHLPVNINLVYGFSDAAPQTWMPPWAWLLMLLVVMPVACYLPAHALLVRISRRRLRSPNAPTGRTPPPDG